VTRHPFRTPAAPVRRVATALAAAGVLALLAGCAGAEGPQPVGGEVGGPAPAGVPSPTATASHGAWPGEQDLDQPPPFEVRTDDVVLSLYAHTFCHGSGCADGADEDPPSVGSPATLFVRVPVDAFTELSASLHADDDLCDGRAVEAAAAPLGGGWWAVTPRGPAGEYRLSLFAAGDGSGDMVGDVLWTTPGDVALPAPTASLVLLADHDGEPDSYGLELSVRDLPATPAEASARITVTAANGRSATIEAERATECVGEGALFFDGPDDEARAAARLGDFPFTTRVALVLDGVEHVATATYPDDEIPGAEPSVALDFSPPLPQG